MKKNISNKHYNKQLKPVARELRKNMTKAEAALWKYGLRKKERRGYTFNRQRPVLNYVADFMCKELGLIIELDGGSHDHPKAKKKDEGRQLNLEKAGFKILRFTNEDVLKNMESVCRKIDEEIILLESTKQK
ncbi:endonuclease domain-containing protein [Gracilimonas halophila]|uniref:Endonuclease domain-containing protein n=1 Tax=Gracilimonas halophila TaxID=1834464 RepID=A0ABW5JLP1_9BACT